MSPILNFIIFTLLLWISIHLLKLLVPKLFTRIHLKTFDIKYSTTRFNSFFFLAGQAYPNFWLIWFNLGVYLGVISMIIGWLGLWYISWKLLVTLVKKLSLHLWNSITINNYSMLISDNNDAVIMPLIPGVNLPLNQLPILFSVLLLAGIWHEMGHGIAGGRERIPVLSSGIFLSLIYPGAFVELDSLVLNNRLFKNQLRVILAGIWHNFTLSTLGYLVILLNLDIFLFKLTFWSLPKEGGISVIDVDNNDVNFQNLPNLCSLVKLNNYTLSSNNIKIWDNLLLTQNNQLQNSTSGYCVKLHDILDSSETCCHPPYPPMQIPSACYYSISPQLYNIRGCLPIETLLDDSISICNSQNDCNEDEICSLMSNYPTNHPHHFTHLKFIPFELDLIKDFLFVGNPKQIYESVKVSELLPRFRKIPASIPLRTRQFFAYLTSLNLALFFLNGLPAFQLDGYHALNTLIKAKFIKFQVRDSEVEELPYFNTIVGLTNLLLIWSMVVSTLCILI